MDNYLDWAIKEEVQTTEMLEVLHEANWRNIRNSSVVLRGLVNRAIYTDVDMFQWLVEHGARLEPNDLRYAGLSRVSVPVMRYLVDEFGTDPLQGTCTLQVAAGRSQEDLVDFLLDVGLDINAIPPQLDVREPGPYTAFYEAAVHHRDLGVTRLLVQRGANINQPYSLYSGQSVLEAARAEDDVEVVAILEQTAL